ncbi:MAG: MtrB/PioB family outer membrane beta-barrel protein, partial [Elusimicrobiota bacterium]
THEERDGARPYGGNFGRGNAVEIPEPIDYATTRLNFDLEYAGKPFYSRLSYIHSSFRNAFNSVIFDNPFRAADDLHPSAISASYKYGSSRGRMALPPSNSYDNLSVVFRKDLPMHSRVTANASYGMMSQHETFIPMTINTDNPGFDYALPDESLKAKVNNSLYTLNVVTKPMEKLHFKAGYRYDQHKNRTRLLTFGDYTNNIAIVSVDASTTAARTPNYVSSIKRTGEFEVSYRLDMGNTLSLIYENEAANFDNGSAKKETENVYKAAWDTRPTDWFNGRLTVEFANKNVDYPDYEKVSVEVPFMRKYYAADRERTKASLMTSFMPVETLNIGFEYAYAKDDYKKSLIGVQDGHQHAASVDMDYEVTEHVTLNAFYSLEMYASKMKGLQWTSTFGDAYSTNTVTVDYPGVWTAEFTDVIHTPGIGIEIANLLDNKVDAGAEVSLAMARGKIDFSSVVGATGVGGLSDVNAFEPDDLERVDDSTTLSTHLHSTYRATDTVDF